MRRNAAILGAAALATAAVLPRRAQAQTPARHQLRVAAVAIDLSGAAMYAFAQGFFRKRGLDVQLVFMQNGPATASAVVGGSLDIGEAPVIAIANARDKGIPFEMIAPGAIYSSKHPTGSLLVLQSSPMHAPKDIIGKTIGVTSVKGVSEMATRAWLDKNGLPTDAVKFLEIPYPDMIPALTSARVDGVVAEEPTQSYLLANGARVFATVNDGIGDQWLGGGWFCLADYADKNPDIVRRFADAIAEAGDWANKNPAASAKILETYTKRALPPNQMRAFYPDRVSPALVQPLIDVSAKYGLLKASFPARDMIAPQVLR